MEASKDAISVRVSRLNGHILGKSPKLGLTREGLLDAFTVLYDECNTDNLRRSDKYIGAFVDKFRQTLWDIKKLRVNISDFEVKNVIGRGHFGEVHVVKEKQTGDVYAMKTIRKSDSLNQKCSSYEEERDIMALGQSAWLTSLQYAFQDSGHLYLVMEFHSGGDLYGLLDRQGGALSEAHAVFYVAELIVAVNVLHSMGYVHRDVKPDNVLLDRCGHLKLADFGSAAKLCENGSVSDKDVISVGTPDYVAPEVLQSNDKTKNRKVSYGIACDYWSVGVLAYEITIGNTPFQGATVSIVYNKIMNYNTNLKFPIDANLSESYTSVIRGLLSDQNARLSYRDLLDHQLFKQMNWTNVRDQVPPFVPKVNGVDDTSNFLDVESKKSPLTIDNFKSKTQFSGRNLPFIGFTYSQTIANESTLNLSIRKSDESVLETKKKQVETLQKRLAKVEYSSQEFEALERKFEEKSRKLDSVENVRNCLEKELANSIAESSALKRTLDLERRERKELESRALELIKSAKLKWEAAEKLRVVKFNEKIEEQTGRITDLCTKNNELTSKLGRYTTNLEQAELELERLKHLQIEHKDSLSQARALSRQSVAGVEDRLERIQSGTQFQILDLHTKLSSVLDDKNELEREIEHCRQQIQDLEDQFQTANELCSNLKSHLDISSANSSKFKSEISCLKSQIQNFESVQQALSNCKEEFAKLSKEHIVKCSNLEEALETERNECLSLKRQLKDLSSSLNESIAVQEASHQVKEIQRESEVAELQRELQRSSDDRDTLNKKLEDAHERDLQNKIKVQSLETLLTRLETGVTKLETSSDRETILQEQVKRLEDQIKELHESSALEKQELRTANTALYRKEKELSNCELDKRILERELKTAEEKLKKMVEETGELNADIDRHKVAQDELRVEMLNASKVLEVSLERMQLQCRELELDLEKYKEKYENEKNSAGKLRIDLEESGGVIEKLKIALRNEEKECKTLNREITKVRGDNIKMHYNMDVSKNLEFTSKAELDNCKIELENAQINMNVLRDVCTLLDGQLEEYEAITKEHELKETILQSTIEELNIALTTAKLETQDAKTVTNEEISLKIFAETRAKRLQEDVELLNHESDSYKDQVTEYKELSSQLSEDLSAAEERCNEFETAAKSLQRQIDALKSENHQLKEESSTRLTHVHQIRESNYKLNEEILEIKDEHSELLAKIVELEESLNEQTHFYKHRELKSDATMQQQTKLIDFLQSKIEDGKKKKTFSDKLFGNSKKENIPPSLALNYRDLESTLMKEREVSRNLRDELNKFKSMSLKVESNGDESRKGHSTPPNSPRTQFAMEQLVRSPASQLADFHRKPSIQRMHHNIPHRFESRLCKKSTKCGGCSDNLQMGRTISICRECSILVHPRCAPHVPRTCGLPKEYAKHFKRSLSGSAVEKSDNLQVGVEGWVKIPRDKTGGWDKKYARLEDAKLAIYEHKPSQHSIPVSTIDLCPVDGYAVVVDEVQASEVTNMATTDLPFILRIDIHPKTTCWPANSQLLMTLNAGDKEKWVSALNELFQKRYPEFSRNHFPALIKFGASLSATCIQEFGKDSHLVGCEEGLFACVQGNPMLAILGPNNVQQIAILKSANLVLMIAGDTRNLIKTELRHLDSLSRCSSSNPSLTSSLININNRDGFHMFEHSDFKRSHVICAATNKQLFILKFEFELSDFVPLRVLDTAEPCSCILFNEHSVIVGANKFFEIDVKTFTADEFLDVSDPNLKNAINCYKLGSYPVAIMRTNANPVEYLLCFSEFGVFVDEFGRKVRDSDIKWTHLPLAFSYCAPFLLVCQFAAVEVTRIAPDSYDDSNLKSWICPDAVRLEFCKPKFLGANKSGVFLFVNNEVIFVNPKTLMGEDSISELSSSGSSELNSEVGTEFSFTSSMVNSLDRLSSADDSDKRTDQTDF